MPNTETTIDRLESLVDQYGLRAVIDDLAEVCREKAEHLNSAWQDDGGDWSRAAARLDACANTKAVVLVQKTYGPAC